MDRCTYWGYLGYIVEKQENVMVFFSICRGLFVQCLQDTNFFDMYFLIVHCYMCTMIL